MAQPKPNGALPDMTPTDAAISLFNDIQHPKKLAFLAAFAACGQLGEAAKRASIDRTLVWYWRRDDPVFVEAFEQAKRMAAYTLRDELVRRALGWDETRVGPDGVEQTVRKYSDTLLIFALKGMLPEEFRDSYPREKGQDISDLLKAVLLELHRSQAQSQAHGTTPASPVVEAACAPWTPGRLPPPPAPEKQRPW